jgi:hypothetical protein
VTLRVGRQLVGIRADTASTLARLRALLRAWIDDTNPDIPWLFDVRLDDRSRVEAGTTAADDRSPSPRPPDVRRPRPVPQLRVGRTLMARSRQGDDVLRALAWVLGGVLARQDDSQVWFGLRAFSRDDRIVLVEATPPALSADRTLARAGVVELPTWCVALDGARIHVPPPLDGLDWDAAGLEPPLVEGRQADLAGLVALDSHADDDGPGSNSAAGSLSRFGVRHPSSAWFSSVERLVRDDRAVVSADRSAVRRAIIDLVTR